MGLMRHAERLCCLVNDLPNCKQAAVRDYHGGNALQGFSDSVDLFFAHKPG